MKKSLLRVTQVTAIGTALLSLALSAAPANPPRQMENLGRGVVAIHQGEGKVFVSWRLLGTEPEEIAFNVYRQSGDGAAVKLNKEPVKNATCFQD